MKTAKILGGIVAGVVALFAIALIAVWLLVDPNHYKGRIEAAVKQATGRDLLLQGDLKLSVFPWVALELGPARLSNLPGFGDEPFLAFNHAAVRVKLLPLLHEELEVAKVELDGLDLRLKKNAEGKGNWESAKAGKPEEAGPQSSTTGPRLGSIGGVKVTHGRVSFNQYLMENFTLETGKISASAQVPVTMSFDASRGVQGEKANLTARLDFQDDPATDDIKLAALSINGTVSRAGDDRPMHYEFSVPALDANLSKQTLAVPDFSLSLSSLKLTGKLSGTQISDDLHLGGTLAVQALVLGEFAPRFGIALPKTRDPKALSALSASMNFAYDAKNAALSDLKIKLDDSTLTGNIDVALEPATALKFALAVDHIDLDRYRPPPNTTPDPKSAAANQPAPKPAGDTTPPLVASGTFALAAAHAAGLDFTNLKVTVDMKDDVTHLYPLTAQLYGGTYSGDLTYDARAATPSLSMDEHLTSVDMMQLAANTKAKGRVSGRATVNIKGTARGADAENLERALRCERGQWRPRRRGLGLRPRHGAVLDREQGDQRRAGHQAHAVRCLQGLGSDHQRGGRDERSDDRLAGSQGKRQRHDQLAQQRAGHEPGGERHEVLDHHGGGCAGESDRNLLGSHDQAGHGGSRQECREGQAQGCA